jgi:hypothetical protein
MPQSYIKESLNACGVLCRLDGVSTKSSFAEGIGLTILKLSSESDHEEFRVVAYQRVPESQVGGCQRMNGLHDWLQAGKLQELQLPELAPPIPQAIVVFHPRSRSLDHFGVPPISL